MPVTVPKFNNILITVSIEAFDNNNPSKTKRGVTIKETLLTCFKKRRRSSVVGKFKRVRGTVWVSFEAVIVEKTTKEE